MTTMVSLTKITFVVAFYAFSAIFMHTTASRVLELSDRFLEIHKDGQWLVMMYAPWCAHCRRLEPIWSHVAQHLHATSIRVGRVDCTRFTSVAHTFKIKGFPTILFLKGDNEFTYHGDRTRDEIVKFALRLSGPPVQEITKSQSFDTIKKERDLYFLYVGERSGPLWELYHKTADVFQPHAFFYQSHPNVVNRHAPVENTPALFVYKENLHYNFTGHNMTNIEKLNETLYKWINAERFPTFPKVTRGNINQLFLTNKNLVLAVVEENQLEEVSPRMIEFRDMVESVIKRKREKYHDHFQFGWIASPDLVNSIAMMVLPLPSLIVINTTTNHHHIPEDETEKLTPHVIELFLEQIRNESAPRYGGNSLLVRIYRSWFELKTTLAAMWMGNPILTMVLFGLPAGFLSLICYGICCPDILDADDEEEEHTGGSHMKKD
ncbi:protein disulfide-isomerase TMX3 isoform X1 [Polistes fuscatus]|uniref:protein disulfide-isomerase TMX3 isoform X1 n=2 Tax=Polistes TaxID=7456 RepID=UPI000718FC76|nr:PREDICTED: protein disulfide-isomerase TMX3 isoform X1 [Polistes canadensis]XP_043486563.1 protein disulfide-isomerase TMX3 isoform X1 [Polistes fuscatus]XP_043486564.1 protein disulfide-isomerase TMX3 isoform X1 [Polistes fuscatus]XP_043486565.1 protein disulfide-isomerase TMX3 isoform X1 [Polistes fuscatus]XP_043486566.1 protein disulfide-isomerase TMX3 isoform X1 [Polistes fuscatus]XP_043486567.1 protein disulfide-isomerase TMX3 isoform X1 [Polistes fuscatus]XP_043486568.1 protein disul